MPPKSGSRVEHAHADGIGAKAAKPGEGSRFAALEKKLGARKGVSNPGALAAFIGREKYGKAKFQKMAAKGRKG